MRKLVEDDFAMVEAGINESLYRAVVEAAPNAMVMVDRAGRIMLVNAQAERMFGAARGDLIGKPVEVLVPERYRSEHPSSRVGFFADPKARAMGIGRDLYAMRRDGSEFPVEIGLNPIETKAGTMVLAAIVDITERKRLEAHFQQVVESAPNGIVMVDREGRIALVNAQAEQMFAAPRAALIGQPVEVLLPERYRSAHPGSRADFFATPKARAMGIGRDLYAMRSDGSEFPVEIGLNPIETAEGTMVLAAIVDITERKRADQALRESEEGFRLLVDGVKDYAIFMIDLDGHVISWNKGAEGIKGYRADEVLGRPFSIFFTEEERLAGNPEEHLRIAKEQGRYEDEVIRVRKDGSRFWASVVLTALRDEQGQLQGYAKITRDITERRLNQESIALALEEKTTLLNEVHHRVKNNLQVISSLFNLQAAHTHDASVKQVLAESQGRVRAMALIHQLLYESRDFSRIHLGDYLARLGQLLLTLHSAKATRIAVRTEVSGEPVYLDLHRAIPCGLLVTELVTNAFKHAFPQGNGGEVRISLDRPNLGEATLAVSDTGVGLPADFQLGQTTSLGLRLVQRLAEQVKGRLVVGENPGASFLLYFKPLLEDEEI
jgi:PAS domain S-box-containing protein